ncbi:MAG: DUF3854 domain-containing protein [Okeania sp. SIO2D1]|nr:DUF3854 domain-containing protein [Okeania sp. SIO2D1]
MKTLQHINQNHLQEWTEESAVHRDIVDINVHSINRQKNWSPDCELFDLLTPNPKRTNSGRLDAAGLKKYDKCLETSGWWINGIDPQTWEDMDWGRFKPDPDTPLAQPHFNPKTDQWEKAAKYRSPSGISSRIVFLRVPDWVWFAIAKRYDIPISEAEKQHQGGFWHWVINHPELPIIFVEGEKKAGCLLSLGYVAIPLPGIWMARRWVNKILDIEELIPDVAIFATGGRQTTIIFDNDQKYLTKFNVYQATVSTAKLLAKSGCVAKVGMLPPAANGKNAVDDFVVAGGDIGQIIENAIDWEDYRDTCKPTNPSFANSKTQWERFTENIANKLSPFTPSTSTTISFCHNPTQKLAENLSETLINCNQKGDFLYNKTKLLKLLAHHDKTIPLNLYPIPGYIDKSHLHKYQQLNDFLTQRGYTLNIGWWEQWYKNAPKIEYLPLGTEISIISWEDFKHKNRYSKRCYKKAKTFTPDIEVNQKYLDGKYIAKKIIKPRSLTGINSPMGTGKSVTIGEAKKIHCAEDSKLPELNEKLSKLIKQHTNLSEQINTPVQGELLPSVNLDSEREKLLKQQTELQKEIQQLTQDIEAETTRLNEAVASVGSFLWSHRNSLLLQNGRELGYLHLRFDEAYSKTYNPKSQLAFCVDSLAKIDYECLSNRIIFIDEISSVIPHLISGSTCRKFRKNILSKLAYALKHAYAVVILDANLKDWEFDYIAKLGEFETVTKLKNTYQKVPLNISFFEGTVNEKGELNPNNYEPLLSRIRNDYANGHCIVISSDSQNFTEYIHDYLGGEDNPEIMRLDGQTISGEKQKAFMEKPNEEIISNGYRVLIYSPSMDTGISIALENYFTKGYSLNFHLGAEAFSQLPGRIRDSKVTWTHWSQTTLTNPEAGANSSSPDKVEEQLLGTVYDDALMALSDEEKQTVKAAYEIILRSKDIHFKNHCKIKAQENYEKANLRETYYEKLIEDGHNITRVTTQKADKDVEWKEVKISVKKRNSELLFNAEDIDLSEAERIMQEFNASPEKRLAAKKAMLTQIRLPGLHSLPIWSPEFLLFINYEDKQCLNRLEMRHLFENPELELCRKAKWFHNLNIGVAEQYHQDKIILQDLRSPQLKAKMLRDIGIDKLLANRIDEFGNYKLFDSKSPELEEVAKLANHWRRQPYFGKKGRTPLIKYINKILARIGYKLTQAKQNERRKYLIEDIYLEVKKPKIFDRVLPLTQFLTPLIAEKFSSKLKAAEEYIQKASKPSKSSDGQSPETPDIYIEQGILGVTQPYETQAPDSAYSSRAINLDLYQPPPDIPLGDLTIYEDDMEDLVWCLELMIDTPSHKYPYFTPLETFRHQLHQFGWNVIKEAAKLSEALALKAIGFVEQLIDSGEWHFAPG